MESLMAISGRQARFNCSKVSWDDEESLSANFSRRSPGTFARPNIGVVCECFLLRKRILES
jgi:hypothetical protein